MKKSSVKLLAGAGVLVVIFGGYYALRQYNAREEERTAAEEAYRETIMEVTSEDVEEVSFEIEGTETTFHKSGDIWKMEGDDTFPVNAEKISEVLSFLAPLQAEETLEDAEDISEYGLDEPQNVLIIKDTAGNVRKVTIGSNNSRTGDDYTMLDDEEDTVYTILTDLRDLLSGDLYTYASGEELPDIASDDIVAVHVDRGENSYKLYKQDEVWNLEGSEEEFDQDEIDNVMSNLSYISYNGFLEHNCEDASEYGITDESVRLTIDYHVETTQEENEDEMEEKEESVILVIGSQDENGNYYVCQEGSREVHTILSTSLEEILDADVDQWIVQETEETDETEMES